VGWLANRAKHALILAAGLGSLLAPPDTPAQAPPRVAVWRAADGLPQTPTLGISLSPRGHVLTVHDAGQPVARLDGYTVNTISNSVGAPTRVHESRSEQLWSVGPGGLLEQTGTGWNAHPIPEIAAEYRASRLRALRPVPLLPVDRNHVLVLLPDRLLEYDAGDRRSTVIRLASETALGRFSDLHANRDDGAWISGQRGLLRIPGPLRQLRPDTELEEFPIPPSLGVTDLQRPFVDRSGAVVLAAEELPTRTRAVLRFAAGQWEKLPVPGQNIRQAWTAADGELWGHTPGSLVRLDRVDNELRPQPILQVGRIADVAVEPNGAAWLATSEGVFRVAPLPWRPAPGFPRDPGPVVSVTTDRRGRVVALSATALHWLEGDEWKTVPLAPPPPSGDDLGKRGETLFPLPDGSVLVHLAGGNQRLTSEGIARPLDAELASALPLGTLPDGQVLFLAAGPSPDRLLAFDGRNVADSDRLPDSFRAVGTPTTAFQTRTGELWIGGERGGVFRRGPDWAAVDPLPNGAEDGIVCALELPDGRLVVGGNDAVREFDGRRWRVLRRGFDRVNCLYLSRDRDRDGSLWVASGSGVHRYREDSWQSLGEEEGLPAAAALSILEDGSGRLWVGTTLGLFTFDPRADPDAPRAEIVGADLPGPGGDDRARFVAGGTDRWRYTPPGRLLYSWRLDRSPWSSWRPASSVLFTNLPAGTHRFDIRALDPSLNIQPDPASVAFDIQLPWFKEPRLVAAFIALAFLLVALAFLGAHSYWRLRRSYAEVESQVAERTVALEKANEELLQSHKMRALGTLAAGVAHDFNNLLSIIRGSAQLLEGNLEDHDKARLRLLRIRTAVDQGAGLVKAMLGYSRGAAAPRRLLDVPEAVDQALRLLDERLQARLVHPPADASLPPVSASPEMLQQIVLNLVHNADEAMMDRGGQIEVSVTGSPTAPATPILKPAPASVYVVVTVRDQGIGIAPENLPRIFEPFFTTKALSTRRGTGLGLSMVYEFAKELGAGLAVQSSLGVGSSFSVHLPASPGHPS
jgi:signal transduction histidine kinase